MGKVLSAPAPSAVGAAPDYLPIEKVLLTGKRGNQLSAWFIPGKPDKGGILLLHGVRSNRRVMLDRAEFLYNAGYSILIFDFQAHGESTGKHITFGYLESEDVDIAFEYLQQCIKQRPIGLLGVSLGGASIVLSNAVDKAKAVVLEATFSSLREAIANRISIRLGHLGKYFTPLLLWQVKPRLGFNPKILSPINKIDQIKAPLLIIGGTKDIHTPIQETQNLYEKAIEPKEFWAIDGAEHENFHEYLTKEYEQRILDFFQSHLKVTE